MRCVSDPTRIAHFQSLAPRSRLHRGWRRFEVARIGPFRARLRALATSVVRELGDLHLADQRGSSASAVNPAGLPRAIFAASDTARDLTDGSSTAIWTQYVLAVV